MSCPAEYVHCVSSEHYNDELKKYRKSFVIKTNLMYCLSSVYFVNQPLHVYRCTVHLEVSLSITHQ